MTTGTPAARFPHRILRETLKETSNTSQQSTDFLGRAIVLEIDTAGSKFNGNSPRGSIKAKVIKPQLDTSDAGETILYPFFDNLSEPVFPTEEVLCIFENDSFDFGYWITKVPSNNKSFSPASSNVSSIQQDDSATAFGVERTEAELTIEQIALSSQNLESKIADYEKFKKNVEFDKRPQDHVISCKNTSRIVLGNDRSNNKESGYEDGEAIDVVVGVKSENGDPSFNDDSSRIYISSKTKQWDKAENKDTEAIAFVRSDNICLIGRKDFAIKSEDGEVTIKIDRDSNVSIETNGKIDVKSGEIQITNARSISINAQQIDATAVTGVNITTPTVQIFGNALIAGNVTAVAISAGTIDSTASPSIMTPSGPVDIFDLKTKSETHIHSVPTVPTPVVSGPPIGP